MLFNAPPGMFICMIERPSPVRESKRFYGGLFGIALFYGAMEMLPEGISAIAALGVFGSLLLVTNWMLNQEYTDLYPLLTPFAWGALISIFPVGLIKSPKIEAARAAGGVIAPMYPAFAALFALFLFGLIALLCVMVVKTVQGMRERPKAPGPDNL